MSIDGFRGKEADTEAISDKNNPEWIRHNVKRAYKTGSLAYWYRSRRHGKGYVDVKPDFKKLGEGKYKIYTPIRMTRNRAKYEVVYEIIRANGKAEFIREARQYSKESRYETIDLGVHHMKAGDYIRMSDRHGSSSIAFAHVYFERKS